MVHSKNENENRSNRPTLFLCNTSRQYCHQNENHQQVVDKKSLLALWMPAILLPNTFKMNWLTWPHNAHGLKKLMKFQLDTLYLEKGQYSWSMGIYCSRLEALLKFKRKLGRLWLSSEYSNRVIQRTCYRHPISQSNVFKSNI